MAIVGGGRRGRQEVMVQEADDGAGSDNRF